MNRAAQILPLALGISALLAGASEASARVPSSDAACFEVDLTEVKRSDFDVFQAR